MDGVGDHKWSISAPAPAATTPAIGGVVEREEHWTQFDDSVNAVSFGFVATAILISMFLLMAIFERFLRSRPSSVRTRMDVESQTQTMVVFNGKLEQSSPKMTMYTNGVSVLMPGEQIPTFIACPAPKPCTREPMSKPPHHDQREDFVGTLMMEPHLV